MCSVGIDKLIQVNVALTSIAISETELQQKLHAMCDITKQQQLLADTNFLLLQNRFGCDFAQITVDCDNNTCVQIANEDDSC